MASKASVVSISIPPTQQPEQQEVADMAKQRILEEESGVSTPTHPRHPHDGYYAGDFTNVPFRNPRAAKGAQMFAGVARSHPRP